MNEENQKPNKFEKGLFILITFILLAGVFWAVYSYVTLPDYKMFLDGEKVEDVLVCENVWHYENVDFIPCEINGTFGGLFHQIINYSLSPQENCAYWNGSFTGFNILNDTRNKEIYDSLLPHCWNMNEREITEEWIAENCECMTHCGKETEICVLNVNLTESTEDFECTGYKCGENLAIEKR